VRVDLEKKKQSYKETLLCSNDLFLIWVVTAATSITVNQTKKTAFFFFLFFSCYDDHSAGLRNKEPIS